MRQLRVRTVAATDEGEFFSVAAGSLAVDGSGGVWVDGSAPVWPSDMEALEMQNLGGVFVAADELEADLVPLMQHGEAWQKQTMLRVYIADDDDYQVEDGPGYLHEESGDGLEL